MKTNIFDFLRRMRALLALAAAALVPLAGGTLALGADLQAIQTNRALGTSVGRHAAYGSTTEGGASIAMRIRFEGTVSTGSASIEVNAGGDMIFLNDAGAADTTVSTDGTIDMSTPPAAEDTMGEVLDIINATANWEAILVDAMRSDLTDNQFITRSATTTSITDPEGIPLFMDASIALVSTSEFICLSVGPEYTQNEMLAISSMQNRKANPATSTAAHWRAEIYSVTVPATFAYGAGAAALEIWAVDGATEIKIWEEVGPATTTAFSRNFTTTMPELALRGPRGYRLCVRYKGGTNLTAGAVTVQGMIWEE